MHVWSESHLVLSDSYNPMDYAHGILQARKLEWVAYPFSSGSSQPRSQTGVSCIAGRFFTNWAIREALKSESYSVATLCSPMAYTVMEFSRPGILKWVAVPFFRASSQPRDWTQISRTADGFFTSWATREALLVYIYIFISIYKYAFYFFFWIIWEQIGNIVLPYHKIFTCNLLGTQENLFNHSTFIKIRKINSDTWCNTISIPEFIFKLFVVPRIYRSGFRITKLYHGERQSYITRVQYLLIVFHFFLKFLLFIVFFWFYFSLYSSFLLFLFWGKICM